MTSHSQQVTSSKSRNNGFSNSYVTDADIWKKTLEAHNEHEKFLEKIGLSTTTTSLKNARFLNSGKPPSFALISTAGSRNRSNLKTPTVFATKSVVDGSKDNISASLDTSKLFQEFYASTKTRTFNNLAENTTALWRSGVDGFQHPIDIRRNIAFRTFHLVFTGQLHFIFHAKFMNVLIFMTDRRRTPQNPTPRCIRRINPHPIWNNANIISQQETKKIQLPRHRCHVCF